MAWSVVVVGLVVLVVVDTEGDELELWGGVVEEVPTGEHASTVSSSTNREERVDIAPNSGTASRKLVRMVSIMFGPLNGVRVALVASAVLAALAALFVGFVGAAIVLLAAVAIHGLGWLYLYSQRQPEESN